MKNLILIAILLLTFNSNSQIKFKYLSAPITINTTDSIEFTYFNSIYIGDSVINIYDNKIITERVSQFIWDLQIPFGYTYFVEIHNINKNKYKYIQITTPNCGSINTLDIPVFSPFFDNKRLCIYFDEINDKYKYFLIDEP